MSRLLFTVGLVLVLVDISSVVVNASPLSHPLYKSDQPDAKHKYCGKVLADIMSTICRGVYKRSGEWQARTLWGTVISQLIADASEEVDLNDYRTEDQEWGGIEPNQYRYDYVRISSPEEVRFVRKRRQIIDECCKNPCTITTLQSYCG